VNVNGISTKLFNSIEKVLRYIVPGLLFVLLVKASYSQAALNQLSPNISQKEFYVLSPVFGFVIYVIHRITFWLLDCICRSRRKLTLLESLRGQALRKEKCPELTGILYYRWALIHFGLVLAELVLVFSLLLAEKGTVVASHPVAIPLLAGLFFVVCFCFYCQLNLADLESIEEYAKKTNC
jgi:hypothetical protein